MPRPAVVQPWQALAGAVAAHPVIATLAVGAVALGVWGVAEYRYGRRLANRANALFTQATSGYDREEMGDYNYTVLIGKQRGMSVLTTAKEEVVERYRRNATNHAAVMRDFVAVCRRLGFRYDTNVADCEKVAKVLGQAYTALGTTLSMVTIGGDGGERILVRCPDPIDRAWNGGAVFASDGQRLTGWVGFKNHWGVRIGTTIYDPTGGYVGGETGWYVPLSPAGGGLYTLDRPLPGRREGWARMEETDEVKVTRLIADKPKTE
ncbi:hypothetical protein [Azospirillum sp. ST 5-10]|uniref:hypothetical protein n=1 Tax=unclassified Azospirillum TaxID=2630922 RepID=UPI003F4A5BF9